MADCRDILLLLSRFRFRDPIHSIHPQKRRKKGRGGGGAKKKERRRVELRDRCDFVACGLSLRLPVRLVRRLCVRGALSRSVRLSRTSGALFRVVGNYGQGVRTGRMDDSGLGFGELWMIFILKN